MSGIESPWGRMLKCIRDDEVAAMSLGKNVRQARLYMFALACGLAGLAGGLYSSYVGFIDPSSASLEESILMLCFVLVGGVGNLRGPVLGALVLLGIPEVLRAISMPGAVAGSVRLLLYGACLVLMMQMRPRGLSGEYEIR